LHQQVFSGNQSEILMGKKCARTWQSFADDGGRTRIVSAPASVLFQEPQAEILFAGTAWEKRMKPLTARRKAKVELARLLLGHWTGKRFPAQDSCGWIPAKMSRRPQVATSSWGQPLLFLSGHIDPSISFSHVGDVTWAALCMDQYSVGIDAATGLDFSNGYPYQRIFHPDEFNNFTDRYQSREKAGAALWSAKEAVVKALGCGYGHLEPVDLRVTDIADSEDEEAFFISFARRAMKRLPWIAQEWVEVRIVQKETLFVSVALVDS
jgi:phosphopantetheinyl transferase